MRVHLVIALLHIYQVSGISDTCVHGGAKYNHGDHFLPNSTLIQTAGPQQCVQCRCHMGLVLCEIEKCAPLKCETPIQQPDYCCQRCPDIKEITNEPSVFSVPAERHKKKNNGCASNGRYYPNGSVWQPVVGPFGLMSCVQCHCHKGTVSCTRYRCKHLPCSHPKKEFGKCCPVCPESPSSEEPAKVECIPKWAEVFVYKTPNITENSTDIEYAFLYNKMRSDSIRLHVWDTRFNGNDLLKVRTMSSKEFHSRNLKMLGATSYKRFRKFSRGEEQLRVGCYDNCFRKIKKLERVLKIYLKTLRNKCNEDEWSVTGFETEVFNSRL